MKGWPKTEHFNARLFKTTTLLLLLAAGLTEAQSAPGAGGVSVVVRDMHQNTSEASSAQRTKLNLTARFVRLPEAEAASFWEAVVPAGRQVGMAKLLQTDAQKQIARWKGLPGVRMEAQFSMTMLEGAAVEISQPGQQTQAGIQEPGAFFHATPRVDKDDNRKIHLDFTAGITNSPSALPVIEKFCGSTSLWDGQTVVFPCDAEKQPAEKKSGPQLLLMVSSTIINDQSE